MIFAAIVSTLLLARWVLKIITAPFKVYLKKQNKNINNYLNGEEVAEDVVKKLSKYNKNTLHLSKLLNSIVLGILQFLTGGFAIVIILGIGVASVLNTHVNNVVLRIINSEMFEGGSGSGTSLSSSDGNSSIECKDKEITFEGDLGINKPFLSSTGVDSDLIKKAKVDNNGIYKKGDSYLIAVGSGFFGDVGDEITVKLKEGGSFKAVIVQTQDKNAFNNIGVNKSDNSIITFIVDTSKISDDVRNNKGLEILKEFKGPIESIVSKNTDCKNFSGEVASGDIFKEYNIKVPKGSLREKYIIEAFKFRGYSYSQSKRMANGFADCSSLVSRAAKNAGLDFYEGHNTRSMVREDEYANPLRGHDAFLTPVKLKHKEDESTIKPGDILWRPGHVEIYIGNGQTMGIYQPGVPGGVFKMTKGKGYTHYLRFKEIAEDDKKFGF